MCPSRDLLRVGGCTVGNIDQCVLLSHGEEHEVQGKNMERGGERIAGIEARGVQQLCDYEGTRRMPLKKDRLRCRNERNVKNVARAQTQKGKGMKKETRFGYEKKGKGERGGGKVQDAILLLRLCSET